MPPAPIPANEAARLAALLSYEVLDTACEEAFDDIARLAARLTGSPIAAVSLVDAERQWFKARVGLDAAGTHRDLAFCAHAILRPGEPLVVPDAARDPRFADNALVTGEPRIRFYAGVPLVNPEGHALGTLCVIDRAPRPAAGMAPLVETLRILARTVATTLELRRAMLQARRLALTDALTGLPNRAAFLDHLGRAIARQRRDGRPFSLVLLDLDGFKGINDRHGHAAGDAALRETAAVLSASLRREDVAARLGGDEFGAILVGGDGQEVPRAAERVRAALARRMRKRGWGVTASVGAVTFAAAPEDADAAVAAADALMYAAKAAGRNRVAHGARRGTSRAAA